MERALEVSCNCYFINLAAGLRPELLLTLAGNMGLGEAVELAEGMLTQPGNLPAPEELANPAAYANFSFGQGSSLASPLQMAVAVAAIANSGLAVTPRLVMGVTEDGLTLTEPNPTYAASRVLSESTAAILRDLMIRVVEEGSGAPAMPRTGSAGGKTSSAQTGQLVGGKEIVHAWFAGFYPADRPRYSIAVFVEGGESGERVAAPIFKAICDGIG
jgi:penicillin-binding protein 2